MALAAAMWRGGTWPHWPRQPLVVAGAGPWRAFWGVLVLQRAVFGTADESFVMNESLVSYLKVGDGECHTNGQGRTRGYGAIDTSHERCREVCEHEACLGYTYEPCTQTCIAHGDDALPQLEGWNHLNGGAQIDFSTGVCGSGCFARMGPCLSGTVVSSGVHVPYPDMPYGSTLAVYCPDPYRGEVVVQCLLTGPEISSGRCRIPCPADDMQSGSFTVPYPQIRHDETFVAMCPAGSQGNLSIYCFDGTPAHVGGICGYDCAPGSVRVGSATMLFPPMLHQARERLDCPTEPSPGWVGEVEFECIDSLVSTIAGTCHMHCAEADLSLIIGNGTGNVSGVASHDNMSHGENTSVPCSSSPLIGRLTGHVDIGCVDGTAVLYSQESCLRHCVAGLVGVGVKAVPHGDMLHGEVEALVCADGFVGNLTVNCTDGTVVIEEGECMMHCQDGPTSEHRAVSITSNGVTLYHDPVEHGEAIEMVCPDTHTGNLTVECFDGLMRITEGFCGNFCQAGTYYINNAPLHYPDITHEDTLDIPCEYPYLGNTTVYCFDGSIRYAGFCGILCPGTRIPFGGASIVYTDIMHTHKEYFGCVTDFVAGGITYSGDVGIYCWDGVASIDGACYADCNEGFKRSNGYTIPHTKLFVGDVGNFTCDPTPEHGNVTLGCIQGEVQLIGDRTCGVPCISGIFSSQETLHEDIEHDTIPHQGTAWLDCPVELSGRVLVLCDNAVKTAVEGGCGARCPSATHIVYGASFTSPILEHWENHTQACLEPYSGYVLVECAYGGLTTTSYCKQGCFAGEYVFPTQGDIVPGAVVPYPDMVSGTTVTLTCPSGYTGSPVLECDDAVVVVAESGCYGHCPAGNFFGDGYSVSHYEILHGETQLRGCPDFHEGTVLLNCTSGQVLLQEGGCYPNCYSGTVAVRDGVLLPHPVMDHGDALAPISCPEGYVGNVWLECYSGYVFVADGECHAHCDAGDLQGASFGALLHGQTADVPCPDLGIIQVQCVDGSVSVISGKCIYHCDAGQIADENGVIVKYGAMSHMGNVSATCQGAQGTRTAFCNDTVVTLLEVSGEECLRHCEAQAVFTDDGTMIAAPYLEHGRTAYVDCPSEKLGIVEVRCSNAVSTTHGSCGETNCAAGSLMSGDAVLDHGAMNNGHRSGPEQCSAKQAGYLGEATFLCTSGTASVADVMMVYENNITGRPNLTELNQTQRIRLCSCCTPPAPAPGAEAVAGTDLTQIGVWALMTGSVGLLAAIAAGSWPMVKAKYQKWNATKVTPEESIEAPAEAGNDSYDAPPRAWTGSRLDAPEQKYRQGYQGDWQRWKA